MTVRSLFKRANRWVKYDLYKGHGPSKCYCLLGALEHRYGLDKGKVRPIQRVLYKAALRRVKKAIYILFPERNLNIAAFNDHPQTTIEDVRKVCRLARV